MKTTILYKPSNGTNIRKACEELVRLANGDIAAEMLFNDVSYFISGMARTAAEQDHVVDAGVAFYNAAVDRRHATTTMALTPYEVLLVHGSRRFYASTELASAQTELTAAMCLTDARMLAMSNDEWDAHFGRINAIRARIAELRAKLPAGGT